jgi:small subunit ribosomal protein S4
MVSHGHIKVNGVRITVPSYAVHLGDKITIRESSSKKPLFAGLDEKLKNHTAPSWLAFDLGKRECKVQGAPKLSPIEVNFDPAAVLNFYSR